MSTRMYRLRGVIAVTCALTLVGGGAALAGSDQREDGVDEPPPGEPSPMVEGVDSDVVASADEGSATPQSHPTINMKTIAASEFNNASDSFSADTSFNSGCLGFDSSSVLRKQIELPHNTGLAAVYMYGRNDFDSQPMDLTLTEISYNSSSTPSTSTLATVTASGDDNRGLWVDTTGSHSVDNQKSYVLRFRPGAGGQFCGVQILYNPNTADDGYVFYPIEPCAAFDTRPSQGGSGKLQPGEDYTFRTRTNLTDQGGAADDCGVPSSARAVQMNLVAIDAEGVGNLRIWRSNGDLPQGGVVNFSPDSPNSNALSVEVNRPLSGQRNVDVRANGFPVHVRGVILGYYERVHPSQIN